MHLPALLLCTLSLWLPVGARKPFASLAEVGDAPPSPSHSMPPGFGSITGLTPFLLAVTDTPPKWSLAQAMCEQGRVPGRQGSGPIMMDAPPGFAPAGAPSMELSAFLVAQLPRWPHAINTLACAVQRGVVDTTTLADGGASLVAVAVRQKHLRLLTSLTSQGASLRYVSARSAGSGGGLAHAALAADTMALDITGRVLRALASRTAATGEDSVATWLGSVGTAIQRHIEVAGGSITVGEGARVRAAVTALLQAAQGSDAASSQGEVLQMHARTIANGLSTLALRTLLAAAATKDQAAANVTSGEPMCNKPGAANRAQSVQVSASGRILDEGEGYSFEGGGCDEASRAARLARVLARSQVIALLASTDRYGRLPLHAAAAANNAPAAAIILEALFQALKQGAHPLMVDGGCSGTRRAVAPADEPPSPAQQILAAWEGTLFQTDALGATPVEVACARGADDVAITIYAIADMHGVQLPSPVQPLAGPQGPWRRSSICNAVLARLSAKGAAGAPAVTRRIASAAPAPFPPRSHKQWLPDDSPVSAAGWPAAASILQGMPRSASQAVRAVRRRAEAMATAASGTKQDSPRSIDSDAAREAFAASCEVDVVDARSSEGITPHEFLVRHVHASRPVLLRGAGIAARVRSEWTASELSAPLRAETPFIVSAIPYANATSRALNMPTTLGRYVDAILRCGHGNSEENEELCKAFGFDRAASAPMYVFEAPGHQPRPGTPDSPWSYALPTPIPVECPTASTCKHHLPNVMRREWFQQNVAGSSILGSLVFTWAPLNASLPLHSSSPALLSRVAVEAGDLLAAEEAEAGVRRRHGHAGIKEEEDDSGRDDLVSTLPAPKPQFFIGPPGSGAPMHWHKDALNFLAWGQKRWFLLPPAAARYSNIPAAEWVLQQLPRIGGDHFCQDGGALCSAPLECTQNEGDLLYVPAGWAHATLNTEVAVGAALEFSSPINTGG